jgi:hypothetical protein
MVSYTPALSAASTQFHDSIHAQLNNCQGANPGAAGGTLSVGETYWHGGVPYQEPMGYGDGSCAASESQGLAIVTWSDGFTTVIGFGTDQAGGGMRVDGSVVGTLSLPARPPYTGSITVTSTRYPAPGAVPGLLSFLPQPACGSTQGSPQAEIQGALAFTSGAAR